MNKRAMQIFAGAMLALLAPATFSEIFGQPPPPPLAFEVASVKPHLGPVPRIGISTSGTLFTAEAYTAFGLIMDAWNLKSYQISRIGPISTYGDTMYDIAARAPGGGREGGRTPAHAHKG